MNRWIVGKELEEKYLPIIKNFIEELESINSETSTDYMEKDFSDTELNPFTLCSLLEELGYNKLRFAI